MSIEIKDLDKIKESGFKSLNPDSLRITVGMASCGLATGAQKVFDALVEAVKGSGLDARVVRVGCIGYCEKEPLVEVTGPELPRICYPDMTPERAGELVKSLAVGNYREDMALFRASKDNAAEPPGEVKDIVAFDELPYFKRQKRYVLDNAGVIDPENIEEYIARGGYSSIGKIFKEKISPEDVIETIKKSGLRGRGGAGFPTYRKWESARRAGGYPKYVICNADEGDPGAFMDRNILESDPHSVIEGMIIGGYAIGAGQGIVYIRHEYPLAVKRLGLALKQAREKGLLGRDIMGSGFDFDIGMSRGGGAFVCGESSALIASIEGKVGEPRPKFVHMAESGLWECPTVLNNVKTWASVTNIIRKGAESFSQIGTDKSKGTMIFALVGKIKNTGLVEVPMGIKLRDLIYEIGGGIQGDKKFKAVQTGGPSGGCVPEKLLDLPVDYEALTEAGSMMGSGGMIVMDEETCMVNIAKYFLNFTMEESCGKCTPCREGIKQMYEILDRITKGEGRPEDIETLETLGHIIKETSLCQLGGSAPNPVLTTLRYFKDEYMAHINEKKCPAGVCTALIEYSIDADNCTGCGLCLKNCPVNAISGEKKQTHTIDPAMCIKCGICRSVCPFEAVILK
ncbi:MAG: NADH-quinone oxidoreductase subunit NuoF [Chloroflexi bacterium]|nr:NADH-quinone oxidoreductase subunit NuoF [Chloroflexota bacterium]